MPTFPSVAIVYLSYHSDPYLDDVIAALKHMEYPKDRVEFIVVDNPHPEYGPSVRALEEKLLPLSGKVVPHITLLPQKENTGFPKGNNIGVRWALDHGYDYVFFHNDDGFLGKDCIGKMVEAMEKDERIASAQALMILHPDTAFLNSAGNTFHYLGFGYCDRYRTPVAAFQITHVKEIAYASGAALMVKARVIREHGGWDEDFFLYHEDLEWALRLRLLGYSVVLVPDAVFYHKYQFSRSITKYYWMERNRYGVMLLYFRWPTLVLLAPMALVLEVGQWIFAWRGGWFHEKKKVYAYWLQWNHWKLWLKKRKKIQAMRTVSDRYLLSFAKAGIHFQEKSMEHPLLLYVGNPIMKVYYWVVVKGLIWW